MPGASAHGASANLDLLRAIAVLLVLLNHLTRHYHYDHFDGVGIFGVLLFFVHTSLVLMYSMQRSHLTGLALVRDFYIRRFFRIYPLSILAVLTAVALHLHADGRGLTTGQHPGPIELVSNLLLIQNLTNSNSIVGPLWSLPLEIQMYLFLPFIFLWKKRSVEFCFWRGWCAGCSATFRRPSPRSPGSRSYSMSRTSCRASLPSLCRKGAFCPPISGRCSFWH
jgi:peptidoglycan/LPS O-acetylase OafA/YrhL